MKPKTNNSKNIQKKNSSKNTNTNKTAPVKGEVWELEPILAGKSFDEWLKIINAQVEAFKKYRALLNDKITPKKVLEIIQLKEEIYVSVGKLETYYALGFYADTKDSEALAKLGQLKQISTDISNEMMFFSLWFMHVKDDVAQKIINSQEIKQYKYYMELIVKSKPYTKSEEIERIINIKDVTGGEGYAELYNIITSNYTFQWLGKDTSKEEIIAYYRSENPKFREKSYELMLTKYKDESTILAEIYKNVVMDWCNDGIKIRGYKNSINIRNQSYDVSDKAIETLLKVIRKNVGIFTEYFKIKYALNKKAGQKYSYSRYHLYAPFITKNKKTYSYDSSKSYVLETYKLFDKRFYDRALQIFTEKHVHSHPTSTKRGGAFCYDMPKSMTPYILLNHTDTLKDMSTMIHELGHGVHDLFSSEKQTDTEKHASLTICETASVFSEMLMADRLLKESKNVDEKRQLIMESLDNQWATIIRQAYFVIFEQFAHEQIMKGSTKEVLDEHYYSLLREQFGDMEIPEVFKYEWNYIPHIHETPFYCYAYAWGNLFVLALYDMYRKEGKSFIDKYIDLLSAGGSDSPENLMKKLGCNPESEEFWQRGFNLVKEEIEELKKLG